MSGLTQSPAWKALAAHRAGFPAQWAAKTTSRIIDAAGLAFDVSRHPVSDETLQLLQSLATQEDVTGWRDKLFASTVVNTSEKRAAEHWALRASPLRSDLAAIEQKMWECVTRIHSGGYKTIINIGIGGSDLGLRLVMDALAAFTAPQFTYRFIANIDPADFERATHDIDPATTLFIVASKSFGTLETIENAKRAKAWLLERLGSQTDIAQHFVAATSNVAAATAFGLSAENCFGFPDTIGGRYSLWGPVGLILRIALGRDNFTQLRDGARAMDQHFQTAPIATNAPIVAALLSIWHTNFWHAPALAVLPYATPLQLLPNYLQQLAMESNGKSVTRDGAPVDYATSPVIFGSAGTLGQHSFYQQLHQGTAAIPADIIVIADGDAWLTANAVAQAKALLEGTHDAALPPHRRFKGQRASTVTMLPSLTPYYLGALLAHYEHKTFMEGVLWRINSFDQWGVELGKNLAVTMHDAIIAARPLGDDGLSTSTLVKLSTIRPRR